MLVVGCFGVGIGATVWGGVMRWPHRPGEGGEGVVVGGGGGIGVPLVLVGLSAAGVGGRRLGRVRRVRCGVLWGSGVGVAVVGVDGVVDARLGWGAVGVDGGEWGGWWGTC